VLIFLQSKPLHRAHAMTTLPSTGVTLVDRELAKRAPFSSTEEAAALAAYLLGVWNVLAPYAGDAAPDRRRQQTHRE